MIFRPLLAGASLGDRLLACAGALAGIGIAAMLMRVFATQLPGQLTLVAPLGASAVLLFAVPASPLAQPWPIVGGNSVAAVIGWVVARCTGDPALAAGLAVSAAILTMSLLRCLHPPGGAVALSAVLAPKASAVAAVVPAAAGSLLLIALGLAFHRLFSRHSYPHRSSQPPATAPAFTMADIDRALAETHETFDVSREDLAELLARAERHAMNRARAASSATRRAPRGARSIGGTGTAADDGQEYAREPR